MKVEITKGEITPGWTGFIITDEHGNQITLSRPDTASLTRLLQAVLSLEVEESFVCPSPDELLIEELLDVCKLMCNRPHSPIEDCPADISDSPCICGFHDAQEKAEALIARVEGR